jgi:hypothetical protein
VLLADLFRGRFPYRFVEHKVIGEPLREVAV